MMIRDDHNPMVAVVLVAYGRLDDTLECLSSLSKSTYKNQKIILVDNASPDNTSEVVKREHSEVDVITSDINLGFAGGNNLGIRKALQIGADYIFLLNNDTEIDADAIGMLIDTMRVNYQIGAIGPMIYYHGTRDLIWSAGGTINFKLSFLEHRGIRKRDTGQYAKIEDVDYLTGCAIMFPASVVEKIGYLDETYWMYYEDADFCVRLKESQYRILFEPRAKVWHKISSSTGGNLSLKKIWFKFRSGWKFFLKHSKSPFWFITYPLSQCFIFFRAWRYK